MILKLLIVFFFFFKRIQDTMKGCNLFIPDFLTIAAAGDNLFAEVMIRPTEKGRFFDYRPFYSEVKPLLKKADIAFVNQESMLVSADMGYSGFPRFGTPREVGHALVDTGFNVVNHASNHAMDKGVNAVYGTLDFWNTYPNVTCIGIHSSEETRGKRSIVERNNIKVGFLSYTYGMNRIPVPENQSYLVSLINTSVMAKEIDALRPSCDLLIVSMHWGTEYRLKHNIRQEKLAHFLADHGVDVIIGHHPHVLEDACFIARKDGGRTLCAYSLGNFISAQKNHPPLTLLGGLLYIQIKKVGGNVSIEDAGILPVVTHFDQNFENFKIKPLYSYTDELAARHHRRIEGHEFDVAHFNNITKIALGDFILGRDSHFISSTNKYNANL